MSFLVNAQGIQIAKAYDLLATSIYPFRGDHPASLAVQELAMQIGSSSSFANLTRDDVLEFAEEIGLHQRVAARTVDEMCRKIVSEAEVLYNDYVNQQDLGIVAGESRLLRIIRYSVIQEMCKRLSTK